MKASLKINKILAAGVFALAAPCAFGQTISASNTTATVNTAFPPGHLSTVTIDRAGNTVAGFTIELEYNTAHLSLGAQHVDPNTQHPRVAVVAGSTGAADFGCVELVVGTLRCVATQGVSSATFAFTIAWTVLGTEVPNPGSPLNWDQPATTFVNAAFADVPYTAYNNGSVIIQAVPAAAGPVLTYAPATGSTVASGSNITVTPSGGQAGGTSNYSCAVPTGVTVTNNPGSIATGGAAATLNVTCPAGTADASMTCTSTGGGTSVTYNVDCPAAPAPILTSTPPTGTPLSCNGTAGSTQTVSATITNSGNANMTGVACNTTGTGFSIQTPPTATIAPGASSPVTVACVVPATGTNTGTLNCTTTAPAGGALAFPLSSAAQSAAVPPQAAIVPASSLWSKLGLVGLLAVLGMLVVGFRRQH